MANIQKTDSMDEHIDEHINDLHKRGGVEIVKASAGSGKTFTLAREYIRLLLKRNCEGGAYDAHRHILAVTFTNKATGEMKSRIIKELDILAHDPQNSNYYRDFMNELGIESSHELASRADKSLSAILNDYGGFSICTIDRFFQKALRSFAKEAGHVDEYQVELDKPSLVRESVDRLLDSLSEENRGLLEWLSESSLASLELGDGYHLENSLGEFAMEYTKDVYAYAEKSNGIDRKAAFSEKNLRQLSKMCAGVRRSYVDKLHDLAGGLADTLDSCEEVSSYMTKFVAKMLSYRDGDEIDFTAKTWTKVLADGSTAFTKKGQRLHTQDQFDSIRSQAMRIETLNREKKTAELLRSQVTLFRVCEALDHEFDTLLKEKNVLSLDDTNKILHDIIGGTDAPFIYEKLGVRYNNFLLDEFQDTARVQWENFRPLLQNSIAESCYNLIVGDVKQSIYRWRNADWSILDRGVEGDLRMSYAHALRGNHRSVKNIVDFNNGFFKELAYRLDKRLKDMGAKLPDRSISGIYSDVFQKNCRGTDSEGGVTITLTDKDTICDEVLSAVRQSHDGRGYSYKDISIIVRTNAEGAGIASFLISNGVPVVSSDSLKISAGMTVRILVSQLYKLDNSLDRINTWYAPESFDPSTIQGCKSLCEIVCRMLEDMDAVQTDKDTLYVLAFLDLVRDYSSRNGNSLHSFLEYWSEEGLSKNISTPQGSDAVTIITIHKVKGLDTPVAIVPVSGKLVSGKEKSWVCPDLSGTPFEKAEKALYNVSLSDSLNRTLFRDDYAGKLQTIFIDVINVWYVAFTRARDEMHIIAPLPNDVTRKLEKGEWGDFKTMSDVIYLYARDCEHFERTEEEGVIRHVYGILAPKKTEIENDQACEQFKLSYSTDSPVLRRGNLHIKSDSADFFSEMGRTDVRSRGIALHGIMQEIGTAEDLEGAVKAAVNSGLLSSDESIEAENMLRAALQSVSDRHWFDPDSGTRLSEREVVDIDGSVYRPDRVMVNGGKAIIIDYKFGEEKKSHLRQILKYASLYRSLGYSQVESYLWYVEKGKIVKG